MAASSKSAKVPSVVLLGARQADLVELCYVCYAVQYSLLLLIMALPWAEHAQAGAVGRQIGEAELARSAKSGKFSSRLKAGAAKSHA